MSEHYVKQNTYSNHPADEVDVRARIHTLWSSKLLIIITTLLVTCFAAAYAFLSTPIYATSVQTLPPTASDLSSYNINSQLTSNLATGRAYTGFTGIKELTVAEAYSSFLQRLKSDTVRQEFFDQVYFPEQGGRTDRSNKQTLWRQLENNLKIKTPTKPDEYTAELTIF